MKAQFFHVGKKQVEEVRKICQTGTYRTIKPDLFPSIIPQKLKEKCSEAVVVASTCESGDVYAFILARLDFKDRSIDEMPLVLVTIPNMEASSCLLHHANYKDRTIYPDENFWDIVNASGIEKHIQHPGSPPNKEGPLSELKGSSQEKGFLKAKRIIIQHDNDLRKKNGV